MSSHIIFALYGFIRSDVVGVLIPTVRPYHCRWSNTLPVVILVILRSDVYLPVGVTPTSTDRLRDARIR